MHLYFYLKHFPPYGDNLNEGTRKAVHGLATGLVDCGAKVTVLCEWTHDSVFKTKAGYLIKCFKNPQSKEDDAIDKTASFTLAPGLKPFLIENQNDSLFILNGIFHRSVYSISKILNRYSVPYIIAPHDPYHPSIFKKSAYLKNPYWHLLEKRVLQQALAVQLLDRRHAVWLKKLHIKTPTIEVPNGFSPNEVHGESTLRWRTKGHIKILFLGRIDVYNKGLDLLISAFSKIEKMLDIDLTIQGPDWGDRSALEAKAMNLGLADKITFLKPDYEHSSSEIIANYDIFCIPSRFEGFSLSALEAMLAGRVVVISDIAGLAPHVIASQCGVVIQPNVASIAEGLQEVIKLRSKWQEMGLRGRNYALKHLHWDRIGETALQSYRKLMAQLEK